MNFNSKNGPMELNMRNMSYAMETLFYRIGKVTTRLYDITPGNELGHVFANLFGKDITVDMYIPALLLHLIPDEMTAQLPVKFNAATFVVGPNKVTDMKVKLDRLFVDGEQSDYFNTYRGLEQGMLHRYDSMTDEHKINAVARRIAVMKFPQLSWKQHIRLLNDMFKMDVFCSLDTEINAIYTYLKENA